MKWRELMQLDGKQRFGMVNARQCRFAACFRVNNEVPKEVVDVGDAW